MTGTVERAELGAGLTISRVVTGLWQIADMERAGRPVDPVETSAAMAPYVEAGLTTFDMADHYGSAEVVAGEYRSGRGAADVQLLTKWVPEPGPVTRGDVRAAVGRALDRLRADRLDLLQFHAWSYADPGWLDCLFWLRELREEGLIRHLGLTNVDPAHLGMVLATGIEVVSNQVCFSLLDRRPLDGMTALCQERGVGLLAYGTVAGGFLTERWLGVDAPDVDALDTWSRMKYRRFIEAAGGWGAFQSLLETLQVVARRHEVSMANVACRWVLEQPAVAGIIIGARLGRSEHIGENLRLFQFSLDEESRAELEAAAAALRVPGEPGDEYRKPPFLTAAGDLSDHFDRLPPPYEARRSGDGRSVVLTGTVWEPLAGFGRAVRRGDRIVVSGTTATHGERAIGGSDPAAQLHFIIDKIEGAIRSLGGRLEDVIRTRIYIQRESDWEAVSRAHGRRFGDILPANTLVQAGVIGQYLVEMEAEAVVPSSASGEAVPSA